MTKKRKPMKPGDRFSTRSFGTVEVKEICQNERAIVEFDDGTTGEFCRVAIVKGFIKNYMLPQVHGVGYLGAGTQKLSKCRAYGIWIQMLERCFTPKYPAYADCTVCTEWLNFTVFKAWYESQQGSTDRSYQIDKDILFKGNKVYSPSSCMLVPANLNKLLENNKASRGTLPLGVSLHKGTKKYTARCCDAAGAYKHLGLFLTSDEAFNTYKVFKEGVIKCCAEKYKGILSEAAYQSLMSWEIDCHD